MLQGVPDFALDQTLLLGVKINEEGEILIKINKLENVGDEVDIFIKDVDENTYHDLREAEFSISLKKGEFPERLVLVFAEELETGTDDDKPYDDKDDPNPDGEEVNPIDPDVYFLKNSSELIVRNPELQKINKITLHSLSGQVIQQHAEIPTQKEVRLPVRGYSSSVYIVKMHTENKIISKKLILNR